ncbi:MAG: carboxymuconolactone decarboxylase family protein [Methanobacteriaceae archaeon]|nr:carboxymuconolactone decarboxylase family protein [Methanobacteriaceae archaeon]
MRHMFKAKKNNELSSKFIERIMLAVTEVNDCAICSYAHTKKALESGMTSGEIQNMLSGITDNTPAYEVAAVMFAQHYADTRGNPTMESWQRIVEIYGMSQAKGILGSIRTIMIGNTYGIVFTSFFNRFRSKPDHRSSLTYELSLMLSTIIVITSSIIHVLISDLFKKPIIY